MGLNIDSGLPRFVPGGDRRGGYPSAEYSDSTRLVTVNARPSVTGGSKDAGVRFGPRHMSPLKQETSITIVGTCQHLSLRTVDITCSVLLSRGQPTVVSS